MAIIFLVIVQTACTKKTGSDEGSFTVAYANIQLSATNLVPVDATIKAHAYAILDVMSDGRLNYDIYCDSIPSGEVPSSFSLYFGKSGQNGTLIQTAIPINLNDSSEVIGNIKLPQAIIDSFTNSASMYIVISSSAHPNGLMRAQISTSSSAFNYTPAPNYLLSSFYKEYSSVICKVVNYHKLICSANIEEGNVVSNEQKLFSK
ncbi:CHRD domain-containing protein [Arachidicoccus soli]|nr:CHRD domain-containing protein [Arachidicoccus soli]